MNSDQSKLPRAQQKHTAQNAHRGEGPHSKLPEKLGKLEEMARQEFVPRLEAIAKALLNEASQVSVRRGDSQEDAGVVVVEMVFGREDTAKGSWTAYLVKMELDPYRNELCLQAGPNRHMNRTIAFDGKDWEGKLIDGFEWLLSPSMRRNLRISN
jgi:hypothetical protein